MRILVAGVGNVLQGDDGFGVETAHRLQAMQLPPEVKVVETGMGGIHLVQEMMAGFDVLIVLDAVDRGKRPGTVMVIDPEVDDVDAFGWQERYDYLADMHYTRPSKALMLAKALNMLPARSFLIGCQPQEAEHLGKELSAPVTAAVEIAIAEVQRLIAGFLEEEQHEGAVDG